MAHVHDVMVIGAGPGGSSTAYFLSRQGADVVLVDRSDFPRDKTCGDGLTPRAVRVLDHMGVLPHIRQHACPVAGYELVAPNGRTTTAPIGRSDEAVVMRRKVLDDLLVRTAVSSGAHFEPRIGVARIETEPDRVRAVTDTGWGLDARVAVIATGAASSLLTSLGLSADRSRVMLAARAYFEELAHGVARQFQLRFQEVPLPGYGWVFPVGEYAANVGVCLLRRPRAQSNAVQVFHKFVDSAALAETLRGGRRIGPIRGYPIRVDFRTAPTHTHRTLLVGESAGLVNPLTGEGIDYALESGAIAAEHILQGLSTGLDARWGLEYDRLLRQRFEKIFRFCEWVRDWYCRPPLLNLLVPLANRYPELRQLLASVVLGEREPRNEQPMAVAARLMVYLARHWTRP